MKNTSIMAVYAACFAAAAIVAAPAFAQNTANSQLLGGGVMQKFSASDVASMMSEFGIQTSLAPYDGSEAATIVAKTSGGAQFFISMFTCDNLAAGTGCQQALVYTGTSNAGFAYEDINTFNGNADITKAVNVAAQNIIVFGAPIYARGGIGRDNFKLLAALFLNDMQRFVDSQSATAASVSLTSPPPAGGKLDNIGAEREPAPDTPYYRASLTEHMVSAAVSNTWKVKFLSEEAAAALE